LIPTAVKITVKPLAGAALVQCGKLLQETSTFVHSHASEWSVKSSATRSLVDGEQKQIDKRRIQAYGHSKRQRNSCK